MISLVCTKCSTVMNVDDGFAGGVCRCSACGTIQTVPRKGEAPVKSGAPGSVIYERASREAVNKELEALGEIVTSSGMVGSGILHQSRQRKSEPKPLGKWLAIAAGALVALGLVWLLFLRSNEEPGEPGRATAGSPGAPVPAARAGASFGSIVLDRTGTVVYLLDRGDATRAYTAPLQAAVARSLATLPSSRRFQVRYWTAAGESPAFPLTPSEPSEYNRSKAAAWMGEVIGGQSTDAYASLDAALTAKPSEIVLITGKAWQMDDSFTNQALARLNGKDIRVHVVSLGAGPEDPLARLASKTGGTYLAMSSGELEQLAGQANSR